MQLLFFVAQLKKYPPQYNEPDVTFLVAAYKEDLGNGMDYCHVGDNLGAGNKK